MRAVFLRDDKLIKNYYFGKTKSLKRVSSGTKEEALDSKLPVVKIFLTAITMPKRYHRQLFMIGWPLLITGTLVTLPPYLSIGGEDSYMDEAVGVVTMIAFLATLVMAVVGCHRLFIFGPKPDAEYKAFDWTGNEIKYSGWWILIGLMAGIISIPLMLVLMPFMQANLDTYADTQPLYLLVLGLIYIPVYYVVSRWSLVLPASATDTHGKSLSWAWDLSSNNGWRLTILVSFLPFITDLLFGLLPEELPLIVDLIIGFVWVVIGVIEVSLLSLSYSFIRSHQVDESL